MKAKAKPIIFSAGMVRAILDGRKTQTRRVIKPQPEYVDEGPCSFLMPGEYALWHDEHYPNGRKAKCPFGKPGGLLWVRENFWIEHDSDMYNDRLMDCGVDLKEDDWAAVWYCASSKEPTLPGLFYSKHPSIHMPRWASRLTLRVLRVWIERVQDISEDDAQAEGVDFIPSAPAALDHRTAFAGLWDKINAKRGFGWEVNPWVWCVEFEVAE